MKLQTTILFLLLSFFSFSQEKNRSFWAIDQKAMYTPASDPATLATNLTSGYKNQLDKVRSIFTWIATHIRYQDKSRPVKKLLIPDKDDNGPLKPLDERVSINVINRGQAVCDGYARLFKTLCHATGIRAETITGYARLYNGKPDRFKSNHTWNAVNIDDKWYLLDVTWASGYFLNDADEFTQYFNDKYFLPPPEDFIQDHYPEDLQWTLLAQPPEMKEYRFSPFIQSAFIRNRVTAFAPAEGTLTAAIGDTLLIEVESSNPEKNLLVTSNPYRDTTFYNDDEEPVLSPAPVIKGDRMQFPFVVTPASSGWLTVLYNGDIIIRYRLVVKKESNYSVALTTAIK